MIHLHLHTEYSLLDGIGKPEQYAKRAKELGMPAMAITDHGNVDGAIKWQKKLLEEGIKPIIGCEMYIVPDLHIKEKGDKKRHITLLVKNQAGWKSLLKMLTIANLEGFYSKPRIDYQTLLDNINDGLIILSGCNNSILNNDEGLKIIISLADITDCYLEIMPHDFEDQKKINKLCLDISASGALPIVATNDSHYVTADQAKAQEVLLAIQRSAKWNDPNRWKFGIDGLHLRSEREMNRAFIKQGVLNSRQISIAIMNTFKVAEQCWDFRIPQQLPELPLTKYEKESKEDQNKILEKLCSDRISSNFLSKGWPKEYQDRYQYELKIIEEKNFARYFLIIYELVEWSKENNIPIGPGRGSVGGSIIAFTLGITQVDPLKYGLLFERFISPDRLDCPDIDLDFCRTKAHLVRQHLEEEYGEYNVAGISTFMSMQARAVIRDVGRVFELPSSDVDVFAKSIRTEEHKESVVEASKETEEGQKFFNSHPDEFKLACNLEGQTKSCGQHPAGLIISKEDLRDTDKCNLVLRQGAKVINWDMSDSEYAGVIKIDVLKLGTLTVLEETKRLIRENNYGSMKDFEFVNLPFEDPKVFKMLSDGRTAGVFQMTGRDCTKMCIDAKVESLKDMAAVISIARPGPKDSGMSEQYIQRKNGVKWKPIHSIYEEITKDTYGVIVYQEQVMKVMTDLAGFSGADADRIRKVIGKKRDPKEFEPFKKAFLKGCREKNTLTEEQANEFWQGLLKHASYSFNLSHAVSYSMIGYWTAWAKLYYQAEFTCAYLTYGEDGDKTQLIKEAREEGMNIVTPKAGISDATKWTIKDNNFYMPFIEIKGIGEKEAEKCLKLKAPTRQGFFNFSNSPQITTGKTSSVQKLLTDVKAFDPDPNARPDDCSQYFQFDIGEKFIPPKITILKKIAFLNDSVLDCTACGLRKQAKQVVRSSQGIFNVLALGEGPGANEDEQGIGFIGDAGDLLWDELQKYGIFRRMLHVGNCCKCYPSETRTPSKQEADLCFNKWMIHEIKSMDCKLILGLGGTTYYALTGRDRGITKASGTMEWVDKTQSHVIWCVHPAYVLRSRSAENERLFKESIRFFATEFNKRKP